MQPILSFKQSEQIYLEPGQKGVDGKPHYQIKLD